MSAIVLSVIIVLYILWDAIIYPYIKSRRSDKELQKRLDEYNKTALVKGKLV